jgi:hypothetical protein
MGVLMGVFVRMQMLVFVLAFHGRSLLLFLDFEKVDLREAKPMAAIPSPQISSPARRAKNFLPPLRG